MSVKVRDTYAEEVEFLRSCGLSPERIAERLGVTPGNLNRALYRAGRNDLARMFNPATKQARRHPCVHCGAPCDQKVSRCWDCRWKAAA